MKRLFLSTRFDGQIAACNRPLPLRTWQNRCLSFRRGWSPEKRLCLPLLLIDWSPFTVCHGLGAEARVQVTLSEILSLKASRHIELRV